MAGTEESGAERDGREDAEHENAEHENAGRERDRREPEEPDDTRDEARGEAGEAGEAEEAGEPGERGEAEERGAGEESGEGERKEPLLPPVIAVDRATLIESYRDAGAGPPPWNWPALPAEHREALVELIDEFVDSYNRTWAMADDQLVPPCWHRHPALAYDLAALLWAYYRAYHERVAGPAAALEFQGQLVAFAGRLDRWLGPGAEECRAGRHPRRWRPVGEVSPRRDRESTEYADEVALLAVERFGFETETETETVRARGGGAEPR